MQGYIDPVARAQAAVRVVYEGSKAVVAGKITYPQFWALCHRVRCDLPLGFRFYVWRAMLFDRWLVWCTNALNRLDAAWFKVRYW